MKKFIIILLFIFVPLTASARLADPSRFPKNEPLRPPAENISPNYSGNVNFSGEPAAETGEAPAQNSDVPAPAGESDNANTQTNTPEVGSEETPGLGALWIVLLAVLAVILAYGFWRNRGTKK